MIKWTKLMALVALAVALVLSSVGCAASNSMSSAMGLWQGMGGAPGVQNLANGFGTKLAANPAVTKFLNSSAIEGAKSGLYNTIAKSAGISLPGGSADLLSSLSGKGLDAGAVKGISDGLMAAGKDQKLDESQLKTLGGIFEPVSKGLGGMDVSKATKAAADATKK